MGPQVAVEAALAAALEHIPMAAFIVSASRRVINANRMGLTVMR
jgi:hypothetical protein